MTGKDVYNDLLKRGVIRIDGNEIVGTTYDGVEVNLGDTHEMNAVYRYLEQYPCPSHW